GTIRIDGHDIREITLASIRGNMGIVTQEVILFNDTIRNNIAYAQQNVSEDAIREAADAANATVFIEDTPNGFNTLIGERGVNLSGGQKQRVAIGRAIVREPSIYLFDDCFSSLDSETEERLISNLNSTFKDKTIVIVSHRLSCLKYSDRIIVLEDGKIIQEGNHSKLIDLEGYYKDLYYKQMKEK
uniref:ATP-binding cassette domain-containing protein n=1 Tax=uncultured Pseudoalteromonas sp. TaxID=114053 RepID=UPI00260C8E5B